MESATIECKLCGMKMRVGQNMAQVHKHNEKAHDIFYNKELCLSLSLLTDEEIQTLIQKVNPRVEQLDSVGIVTDQKNIFKEVENRHGASRGDIDDIQSLLQDDNSEDDSDNDLAEESEPKAIEYVTPQIKPSSVRVKRLSEIEINKSTNSIREKSNNEVKDDSKNAAAQMILSWLDDSDSDSDDKSSSLVTDLESLLEENPLKKRKLEEVINEDHEDSDICSNKKLKVSMTKTAAAVKTGKKGKKAENNKIDDFISSLQSQRQVGRK